MGKKIACAADNGGKMSKLLIDHGFDSRRGRSLNRGAEACARGNHPVAIKIVGWELSVSKDLTIIRDFTVLTRGQNQNQNGVNDLPDTGPS